MPCNHIARVVAILAMRAGMLLAALPAFDPRVLAARAAEARCATLVHVVARRVAATCDDARWAAIADAVPPARPAYAARVLAALRGARRPSPLVWRLEVRGASDSRPRAVAAVAASALRELEIATDRFRARAP